MGVLEEPFGLNGKAIALPDGTVIDTQNDGPVKEEKRTAREAPGNGLERYLTAEPAANEDLGPGVWRTVGGRHVFIGDDGEVKAGGGVPARAKPGVLGRIKRMFGGGVSVDEAKARLDKLPKQAGSDEYVVPPFKVSLDKPYDGRDVKRMLGASRTAEIPLSSLITDQDYVSKEKVSRLIDMHGGGQSPKFKEDVVVVRSGGKNYLYEGHHRSVALAMLGEKHVNARLVDMDHVANEDLGPGVWRTIGGRHVFIGDDGEVKAGMGHGHGHELEHAGHQYHEAHEAHEVAEILGGSHKAHEAVHEAHEAAHEAEHIIPGGGHGGPEDAAAIVVRHLYRPAARAAAHLVGKVRGGRRVARAITAVHEGMTAVADAAVKGIKERYGDATASAILGSGSVLSRTVMAAAHVPGTLAKAIPGPHLIGSIPMLALAEAGKRAGLLGKDSRLEKALGTAGTWIHAVKAAVSRTLAKGTPRASRLAGKFIRRTLMRATGNAAGVDVDVAGDELAEALMPEFHRLLRKHAAGLSACSHSYRKDLEDLGRELER